MHGRNEVDGRIPVRPDALEVDGGATDLAYAIWDRRAARQDQVPILERLQARAKVEAQELGERHRKVGVAVRVDGELRDVELLVADDAFDGGAGLALVVEHEGLSMEDAPALAEA